MRDCIYLQVVVVVVPKTNTTTSLQKSFKPLSLQYRQIDCQDVREEKRGGINSLIHTQLCEALRIDLTQITKQEGAVGARGDRKSYFTTRFCLEECIVVWFVTEKHF